MVSEKRTEAVTQLYLVRHCQSTGNLHNVFQGHSDEDISDFGAKQLALLALRFRNVKIDAIYSSPLMRAMKTAEAVNEYHKLPIVPMEELIEVDVGQLEGQKLQAVFEEYPEFAEIWNNRPHQCVFPGGESTEQVYARAQKALKQILHKHKGESVAVASHGFLLRCMVCALLRNDLQALPELCLGGNTAVSKFEISENGVKTVYLNDMTHLPSELLGNPNQYVLK